MLQYDTGTIQYYRFAKIAHSQSLGTNIYAINESQVAQIKTMTTIDIKNVFYFTIKITFLTFFFILPTFFYKVKKDDIIFL